MVEIIDQSSLHKCRTELPNIIFNLGLDPYAFRLYCAYKQTAGDRGKCWKSNKHLAEACNMSLRKLILTKKTLTKKYEQLGNKPLIIIEKRKTKNGGPDTDLVTIIDIWPENMNLFLNNIDEGRAPHARGVMHKDALPHVPCARGHARAAYKEDPINKININKEKEGVKQVNPPPSPKGKIYIDSEKIERAPHVYISEKEHAELAQPPNSEELRDEAYHILSEWKEDTPKSKWKKNDYRSIKRWVFDAIKEKRLKKIKGTTKKSRANPNISQEQKAIYDGLF